MDQETELVELSGTIDSIIYKNEENGYTVLRMSTSDGETATVVGCFPFASTGESIIVSGGWTTHSVHGRQFKAEFAQRTLPTTAAAIYAYLAGGLIKGVGPATASLIVNTFKESTLKVLENSPEELSTIKGISLTKAKQICKSFKAQVGVRRLMEFVCSFGVRPVIAMRMYKFYGDKAMDILREDPYIMASGHIGGTFAEADALALETGTDTGSPNRICAAAIFELVHNLNNGHCFIPFEKLTAVTAQLIGVPPEDAASCIESLAESGRIVREAVAGCDACYLPPLHEAECDAAERLSRLCSSRVKGSFNIEALLYSLEKSQNITYAPLQRKTLELALNNRVVVITGGPGTGKTTSIRAILAMFNSMGLKTLLTAPTGRAAKRMEELSGNVSSTVHRLLEAKFDEDGERVVFTRDENNPLECDAIILDESSMVDIILMDALLRAMPDDARLVMVGDADQLPSVGPGNVFSAVIRSESVPTVRLTEIFRQSGGSRIVRNAHLINKGEHPNLAENAGDFFRLKRLEAGSSVDTITELCAVRLPQKMNIPSSDIQILTPTRKGELGTASLNRALQKALNPPGKEKREKPFGDIIFREGDRVMQIKNNYDILWRTAEGESSAGIYNGDIGRIERIDPDNETITVSFDGRFAEYGYDGLIELEHAWAMTVHKAQGSEYRAVILALSSLSQMLMTRDILYTAVTRAKELLVMVGDEKVAFQMIDNYRQTKRYSALRVRLRELCAKQAQ